MTFDTLYKYSAQKFNTDVTACCTDCMCAARGNNLGNHVHGLMLMRKSVVGTHSDVLKELCGKIGSAHVIGSMAGCNTTANYPCNEQQSRGIRSNC